MISLQTVAMGLVIVFLDVPPTGYDWVADPLGWILVLIGIAAAKESLPNYRGLSITAWVCLVVSVLVWPADSVATLDDSLGWGFSLPTLAWCFLVCDALHDVTEGGRRITFLWLRNVFAVVAALPVLVYGGGIDVLTVPTAVLAVASNLTLLYLLWVTADESGSADEPDDSATGSGAAAALRAKAAQAGASAAASARTVTSKPGDKVRPWQTPERVAEREKQKRSGRSRGGNAERPAITGAEVVERVRKRSKARKTNTSS